MLETGLFSLVIIIYSIADCYGSPVFRGTEIPVPPQQGQPWDTPDLEEKYLPFAETVRQLFDDGMADPRGCEYREVKFAVGNCWFGDAGVIETHAWVLPAKTTDTTRFAVAWNGLIYPLVDDGALVDLNTDIEILQNKVSDMELEVLLFWTSAPGRNADNEMLSCKPDTASYTKACLMIRLGLIDEACSYIDAVERKNIHHLYERAVQNGQTDRAQSLQNSMAPPDYQTVAKEWTWSHYNRAICAQMRGDDPLAAASLDTLVDYVTRLKNRIGEIDPEGVPMQLRHLAQLKKLHKDIHRRIQAKTDNSQTAESVPELIADLENVNARQWGQPGGVSLDEDERIQKLIEKGEEVVEPLIDCLEQDQRFTRSVKFRRDFAYERTVIGVHEVAYYILANILEASFYHTNSTADSLTARGDGGRSRMAGEIRDYWKKYKGLSREERWFTILQDDAASNRWVEAANNISRPTSEKMIRGSQFAGTMTLYSDGGASTPTMAGESLRSRNNPCLSDLLIDRMEQLREIEPEKSTKLAIALSRWDIHAGTNAVARLFDTLEKHFVAESPRTESKALRLIVHLTQARTGASDPSTSLIYVRCMANATIGQIGSNTSFFKLMADLPDTQYNRYAAEKMFGPDGIWKSLAKTSPRSMDIIDFWHGLAKFPAFRENLLACLNDSTECGTIEIINPHAISFKTDTMSGSKNVTKNVEDMPPIGTILPLRVCDLAANQMNEGLRKAGAPEFELACTAERRDRQLEHIRKNLTDRNPAQTGL